MYALVIRSAYKAEISVYGRVSAEALFVAGEIESSVFVLG